LFLLRFLGSEGRNGIRSFDRGTAVQETEELQREDQEDFGQGEQVPEENQQTREEARRDRRRNPAAQSEFARILAAHEHLIRAPQLRLQSCIPVLLLICLLLFLFKLPLTNKHFFLIVIFYFNELFELDVNGQSMIFTNCTVPCNLQGKDESVFKKRVEEKVRDGRLHRRAFKKIRCK